MNTHAGVTISIRIPVSTPSTLEQKIRERFAARFPGSKLNLTGGESGTFVVEEIEFAKHHPFAGDGNVQATELASAGEELRSCLRG